MICHQIINYTYTNFVLSGIASVWITVSPHHFTLVDWHPDKSNQISNLIARFCRKKNCNKFDSKVLTLQSKNFHKKICKNFSVQFLAAKFCSTIKIFSRGCWAPLPSQTQTKEDIGIEQQLYDIVNGKHFALNCLSWKFTEMILITNEVIPENLVVVR